MLSNKWAVIIGLIAGLLVFAGLAGFAFLWFPFDEVLMDRPSAADLVGTYHLTGRSAHFLTSQKHYASIPPSSIEVRSDATIRLDSLPDCAFLDWGDSGGQYLSGNGTWTIDDEYGLGYSLNVDIQPGGTIPEAVYYPLLVVRGYSRPYQLEMVIGDPDNGETIRYSRSQRGPDKA